VGVYVILDLGRKEKIAMAAKGMRHPRTGQRHGQSMAPPGGAGV